MTDSPALYVQFFVSIHDPTIFSELYFRHPFPKEQLLTHTENLESLMDYECIFTASSCIKSLDESVR